MPSYSIRELDDLEEQAEEATPQHQAAALALVSRLLDQNSIAYGLMGGMNFYLRGSGRTTSDIDIAVDNRPRMESLLDVFNNSSNIWRPANKMQWVSGVARLFVNIQGTMVQIDLMPKGAEGHLIPSDLRAAVDTLDITSTARCKFLSIGPLVATKIKAHHDRETRNDYVDLLFVCTSASYAPLVRQAAHTFRREWKECLLKRVIRKDPGHETQVRWALGMEPGPSSGDRGSASGSRGNGGGGSRRDGESSRRSAPRDGEKSKDGYWTFSGKHNKWYHRSSNGSVKWSS